MKLKLYTTLPTTKLASFMDVRPDEYDSFLGKLLTFKVGLAEAYSLLKINLGGKPFIQKKF